MAKTGSGKLIPRFPHQDLSQLILKSCIYMRYAEEIFGGFLWGEDAQKTISTHLFYSWKGGVYGGSDLTKVISKFTGMQECLGEALDVQSWRHACTGISRKLIGLVMEAEEDANHYFDLQAGRLTSTSDAIYARTGDDFWNLNAVIMDKFRKVNKLWHSQILKLKVNGRILSIPDIMNFELNSASTHTLHPLPPSSSTPNTFPAPVLDLEQVTSSIKDVLSQFLQQDLIPGIMPGIRDFVNQAHVQSQLKELESIPTRAGKGKERAPDSVPAPVEDEEMDVDQDGWRFSHEEDEMASFSSSPDFS
jgi:hypothetical protein